MIEHYTVKQFLDELASSAATPGGGSAAAVLGAMAAALLSMVCNLTIGKRAYAAVEPEMRSALDRSEALRARLEGLVEADVEVFAKVMAAYGLPRGSESEQRARKAAIEAALKEATLVPLECARACAELVELSRPVAERGNKNVVSDAGVGVLAAHAALRSAALNVYINTASMEDKSFARAQLRILDELLGRAREPAETVYEGVVRALG